MVRRGSPGRGRSVGFCESTRATPRKPPRASLTAFASRSARLAASSFQNSSAVKPGCGVSWRIAFSGRAPFGSKKCFGRVQDLPAVHRVLDGVVPIEDLHRVGAELVGEGPVAHGAVSEPHHLAHVVDVLDLERLLERELAKPVHDRK
jgi:hypothetical protein